MYMYITSSLKLIYPLILKIGFLHLIIIEHILVFSDRGFCITTEIIRLNSFKMVQNFDKAILFEVLLNGILVMIKTNKNKYCIPLLRNAQTWHIENETLIYKFNLQLLYLPFWSCIMYDVHIY